MAWVGCLLFISSSFVILVKADVIRTSTGWIRGERRELDGKPYDWYRGIPYAEPPVGSLRFSAPVTKSPWDSVYNATSYGPSCPQNISAVPIFYPDYMVRIPRPAQVISEDCLTLNIFAPAVGETESGLAVMFWIHGGSFETGQGSGYDASALATRGDVVVVTINYRLNVFGFLCTDDANAPGNYGLLDQQLALQWVHDNIEAFGGDPSRVTLFGQSAGGASVTIHLLSDKSRPLFRHAVAHSGYFQPKYSIWVGRALSNFARKIAEVAGCVSTTNSDLINCLRERSMEDVLAAGQYVAAYATGQIWRPVVDGNMVSLPTGRLDLQHNFMAVFTSGDGSVALEAINILSPGTGTINTTIGLTEDEWEFWLNVYTGGDNLSKLAVSFEYIDNNLLDKDFARMQAITETMMEFNFLLNLKSFLNGLPNSPSKHMGIFDHRCTANVRYPRLNQVPHGEEIPFLFGLPFNGSGMGSIFTKEEKALSERVITYWSNFAKSGQVY